MNEEVACTIWLRDYLEADATLASLVSGVWVRSVPQSEPLPVVKIDHQESNDLYTVNLYRVWADLLFLVRGIVHWRGSGQQDWTDAQAIGDRLDVLLHKVEVTSSRLIVTSSREQSYTDEQQDSQGGLLFHCGGFYRIRAHAL
jgi:hypothetical protein